MGIAAIGLALTAVGTYTSYTAQKRQERISNRQAELAAEQAALEKRKADVQNARQRAAALRHARVAQSDLITHGGLTGTLGTSGFQGGMASLGSQAGERMTYLSQMGQLSGEQLSLSTQVGETIGQMGRAQAQAGYGNLISGVGGMVMGPSGYRTLFGEIEKKTR